MRNTFPEIITKRLLLRHIIDSDINNIFKGLSHRDVIKYYGVNFKTLEATKEQMTWYIDLKLTETGIWWAICSHDNKSFYGAIGINDFMKEHKKAEIGFWLLPEYWGKGFISEAISPVLEFAFTKLSLSKIVAYIETENKNSKRLMEKSGFIYTETIEDCEIKNGKAISLELYSKTKKHLIQR